ncbi:MAG: hypothetical protein Q8M65_10165, partial [Rhodoglobus sp.]|nr:hypothetical protein [Rhodoglobus sp.]
TSAARFLLEVENGKQVSEAVGFAERGCSLGNAYGCRMVAERCANREGATADCAARARERACALGDDDASCSARGIATEGNP